MHDDFNFTDQDLEASLYSLYCFISYQTIPNSKNNFFFGELTVIGSTYPKLFVVLISVYIPNLWKCLLQI